MATCHFGNINVAGFSHGRKGAKKTPSLRIFPEARPVAGTRTLTDIQLWNGLWRSMSAEIVFSDRWKTNAPGEGEQTLRFRVDHQPRKTPCHPILTYRHFALRREGCARDRMSGTQIGI